MCTQKSDVKCRPGESLAEIFVHLAEASKKKHEQPKCLEWH